MLKRNSKLYKRKIDVGIIMPDLSIAGAQRVAIDYGNKLKLEGLSVSLIVSKRNANPCFNSDLEILDTCPKIFLRVKYLRVVEQLIRIIYQIRKTSFKNIIAVNPFLNRYICILKAIKLFKSNFQQ